jgi:uncharacterized protein (TIGR02466 family)
VNTYNIFPTTVGIVELKRELTQTEKTFILNQDKKKNEGNTTSVDNYILKKKKLNDLKKFIEDSVTEYVNKLYSPKTDLNVYVTQSWINYTEKGQYHHKHAHPNSFISGVFYVNADITKDKIHFYKNVYEQFQIEPKEWNVSNSPSWWFEVGTGKLILFPSSLTHMVKTVESEETRISLSFNTFIKGKLGINLDLTELILGD